MLVLYVTDDCMLCDEAIDILARAHAPDFTAVCIDDRPDLCARYGLRVPVLVWLGADRDLGWPFDVGMVSMYVKELAASSG